MYPYTNAGWPLIFPDGSLRPPIRRAKLHPMPADTPWLQQSLLPMGYWLCWLFLGGVLLLMTPPVVHGYLFTLLGLVAGCLVLVSLARREVKYCPGCLKAVPRDRVSLCCSRQGGR